MRKTRKHTVRHHKHTKPRKQHWILRYRFAIIGVLSLLVVGLGGLTYMNRQAVLGIATERGTSSSCNTTTKRSVCYSKKVCSELLLTCKGREPKQTLFGCQSTPGFCGIPGPKPRTVTPTKIPVYSPSGVQIHVQTANGQALVGVPVTIYEGSTLLNGLSKPSYKTDRNGNLFFPHTQDHGPLSLSVLDQANYTHTSGVSGYDPTDSVYVDKLLPSAPGSASGTGRAIVGIVPCGSNKLHQPPCILTVSDQPYGSSIYLPGPRYMTLVSLSKTCVKPDPYDEYLTPEFVATATWTTNYFPTDPASTFVFHEHGSGLDRIGANWGFFDTRFSSLQYLPNTFYTFTGSFQSSGGTNDYPFSSNVYAGIEDQTSHASSSFSLWKYDVHTVAKQVKNCGQS